MVCDETSLIKGIFRMKITAQSVWADVLEIRHQAPLVHNITNYVAMNTTANALLALGASPVMAHAQEEVANMVGIAKALVINIGTLSEKWIESMQKAMLQAKSCGVPIVLDPVGAGATAYRTETARQLLSVAPVAIIRGNASEIMAIVQTDPGLEIGLVSKGVDSISDSESAVDAARELNRVLGAVVCITGETDFIVSNDIIAKVKNGHTMMPRVTGLGCTASALCGAFLGINISAFAAAVNAMVVMGIAGELAAEQAKGPGSLQLHFIDTLYTLTESDIIKRIRLASCLTLTPIYGESLFSESGPYLRCS
jgi:hydroxyethylthiazole kinase